MAHQNQLIMDQKIDALFQELEVECEARINLESQLEDMRRSQKCKSKDGEEDTTLIKVDKHTLEAQAKKKESKISQ